MKFYKANRVEPAADLAVWGISPDDEHKKGIGFDVELDLAPGQYLVDIHIYMLVRNDMVLQVQGQSSVVFEDIASDEHLLFMLEVDEEDGYSFGLRATDDHGLNQIYLHGVEVSRVE